MVKQNRTEGEETMGNERQRRASFGEDKVFL